MTSMEDQRTGMEEEKKEECGEEEPTSLSFSASVDSETPQLSAATLSALLEFYQEEEEREEKLREVREGNIPEDFTENWVRKRRRQIATLKHLPAQCHYGRGPATRPLKKACWHYWPKCVKKKLQVSVASLPLMLSCLNYLFSFGFTNI